MVDPGECSLTYSVDQPPFVGRRAEVDHLLALHTGAKAGATRVGVVAGPAGVGKTALVEKFLEEAGEACVLRISGEESETALAFGVFDQLCAAVRRRLGDDSREGAGDGSVEPLVAGAELVDLLGQLQRFGSVILVVDDAHWADRPSLIALTFALRRLSADHVLALFVLRDFIEAQLPHGLMRLLTGGDTFRLTLRGLSPNELVALSARVGGVPLSDRGAARLHAHTGGHPLHARALIEQLPVSALEDGNVPLPAPREFALPVVARMAACGGAAQSLLAAASVLGRRCPLHLAFDVAGVEDGLEALDEAAAAGLVREVPATRQMQFTHPLVRAAVYGQLGAARRRELHLRAAGLVGDEQSSLRHRVRAAAGPDSALAREVADVGRRRVLVGDWGSAVEYLNAAAELLQSRDEREQLAAEAIDCQLMVGDAPDITTVTARLHGFKDSAWRSFLLARIALVEGRLDDAEPLLEDAWRRSVADGDRSLAPRVAGQLGWLSVARDRGGDAVTWSDRAMVAAGELGPTDVTELSRLVALGMSGRAEAALASLGELPEPTEATVLQLDELLGRARLRSWTDDLAGAYADLTGVLDAAQDRSVTYRIIASTVLAEVEYLLGRWDDALLHGELAVSLARDAEHAWLVSICDAVTALVPAARGLWLDARRHVEAGAARIMHPGHLVATSYVASARAHLAAARSDHSEVIATLRPLLAHDASSSLYEPGVLMAWQDLLVESLAAEGQLDEALAVLEPLEARAAERNRPSALAAASRARGTWRSARRQHEEAAASFRRGLDHLQRINAPFERSRLELALGAALRRAGKRRAAARALAASRSTLADLGATPYIERCDRELAACGTRSSPGSARRGSSLTAQEFAVAHLAGRGLTNRQIARELFISVKTVEYHLGHVYAKMHVTSRVQLSSQLHEDMRPSNP